MSPGYLRHLRGIALGTALLGAGAPSSQAASKQSDSAVETIAAGAALAGAAFPESLRTSNPSLSYTGDVLLHEFNGRRTHIQFPETFKLLTSELTAALSAFQAAQQNLIGAVGQAAMQNKNESTSTRSVEPTPTQHDSLRMEVWKTMQGLPGIETSGYSPEDYLRALSETLPRSLADYGILAKPAPLLSISSSGECRGELTLEFLKIRKVTPRNMPGGTTQPAYDQIEIEGPLLPGASGNEAGYQGSRHGQTLFGNIIVFGRYTALTEAVDERIRQAVKDGTLQKAAIHALQTQGESDSLAIIPAQARLIVKVLEHPLSDKEDLNQILRHEEGHLREHRDHLYLEKFRPGVFNEARAPMAHSNNLAAQEEVTALLSELRDSKRVDYSLFTLLGAAQGAQGPLSDYGHQRAARWILSHLIPAIEKSPEQFGVSIDPALGLSPRTQVMLQLDKICERPDAVHQFADEILEDPSGRYREDLSDEFMAGLNAVLAETPSPAASEPSNSPYMAYIAAALGALSLTALGLGLHQRGRAAQTAEKTKAGTVIQPGQQKDAAAIEAIIDSSSISS